MSAHDYRGWHRMTCSFCGIGSKVHISILIATDHKGNPYPYSQTEMCNKCWNEHGIEAAMEHNRQCRDDS